MNREDATQIQQLAIEACDAIKRMEEIVLELSREDRSLFANHFEDAYTALQFGILKEIHDRHPDLRPGHQEPARVSSFLKWEDVCLPAGVFEADLDAVIFSVLKPNWQKTAMVISKTSAECTTRAIPLDFRTIGARILALTESDHIESVGNPAMWRHSELRPGQNFPRR